MKAGASGSEGTGVGKDFLIPTWKGNFGVEWTASHTPARFGEVNNLGGVCSFAGSICSVFRAFPPSLVTVVCLKLVLVWPVGEEWIAESGIYSEPFAFQVLRAGSLVYFKSGETWAQEGLVTKPLSSWSELDRSLHWIRGCHLVWSGKALPCPTAHATMPPHFPGGYPFQECPPHSCPMAKVSSWSTHCHLIASLGLTGISSSRVTLEQDTR